MDLHTATARTNYVVYGLVPLGIIITHVLIQQSPSKLSNPASPIYQCHHSWAFQLALTMGLIPAFFENVRELFANEISWGSIVIVLNLLALGFVGAQLLSRAYVNALDDYRREVLSRSRDGKMVNIRLIRVR